MAVYQDYKTYQSDVVLVSRQIQLRRQALKLRITYRTSDQNDLAAVVQIRTNVT